MKINALKLQVILGENGLLISELAELSGVSRQTISYILSGKSCSPAVAGKIAEAVDVNLEELIRKED